MPLEERDHTALEESKEQSDVLKKIPRTGGLGYARLRHTVCVRDCIWIRLAVNPLKSQYEKAALPGGLVCINRGGTFLKKHAFQLFNDPCLAERLVDTALLHSLQAFGRDANSNLFVELWYKDGLFLDIHLVACLACWVELGCACTVRIAAPNATSLACDNAFSCHMRVVCYHSAERYANGSHFHHISDSDCHV